MLTNSPVLKIKERLGIEEVVSSYIKLEKAGTNFKARCPFHNEKTPSFFVSPERNSYYCFGCGAKGDIFTFVEEFEGLDFKGALRMLAERAHIPLAEFSLGGQDVSEKDRIYEVMEKATEFFEQNFKKNKYALEYLENRGLDDSTIQSFRIGYANNEWRELRDYLKKEKFTDIEIAKAGLTKQAEKKPGEVTASVYDRFRGRIMFPIADSSGRVIAFSGRIFPNDEKSAKYLNSPETPIFKKSAVLYGLDKAKIAIRKNNFSILVEGQMDLLLSHQAGFKNTVATSGTAFSDELEREEAVSNLGLLRRISTNVVLAFDGDQAGIKAVLRAGKIALSLGMDVKVAVLPEGVDPADIVSKNGKDTWRQIIRDSKPLIEFALDKVLISVPLNDRRIGKEIKEKVLPFVVLLPNHIDQEFSLQKISGKTGISIDILKEDTKTIENISKDEKNAIVKIEENRLEILKKDYILKRLLGILFWQENKDATLDIPSLLSKIRQILGNEAEGVIQTYNQIKEDLIYEAESFYSNDTNITQDVAELLKNLEEESLKEALSRKMMELYNAEEKKDDVRAHEILKECQIISNKIQELKNNRSVV